MYFDCFSSSVHLSLHQQCTSGWMEYSLSELLVFTSESDINISIAFLKTKLSQLPAQSTCNMLDQSTESLSNCSQLLFTSLSFNTPKAISLAAVLNIPSGMFSWWRQANICSRRSAVKAAWASHPPLPLCA